MVTVAGTEAATLSLVREMTAPSVGAGPLSETVLFVVVLPPMNAVGDRFNDETAVGETVRTAVRVTPPAVAPIVTFFVPLTLGVVTVNDTELWPVEIMTVAGTGATTGSDVVNVTTVSVGTAALIATVTVLLNPPATEAGASPMELRARGCTVITVVRVTPPYEAEMLTVFAAPTAKVSIEKNAEAEVPAGTEILDGTLAVEGSELARVTTASPAGAGPFKLSQQDVIGLPPTIDVFGSKRLDSAGGFTLTVPDRTTPFSEASIVTRVAIVTGDVCALNDAKVAPAGTVTLLGTDTIAGCELVKATCVSVAAGPVRSTSLLLMATPPPIAVAVRSSPPIDTGFTVTVAVAVAPL
jgi:hypothetical protein